MIDWSKLAESGRGIVLIALIILGVLALAVAAAFFFGGCGPSQPAAAPAPAPSTAEPAAPSKRVPAMTLRVASLDVSGFSGRIAQEHVDELARLIADRKIEMIAIQGITRYPTVKTRIDLVGALAAAAGMREVFGETINLSGRQSGNAVLSSYPIASSDSRGFEGVAGTNFEGALRVIVDAGTRPVVVVSTLLPDPLSAKDSKICVDAILAMTSERGNDPLLVLGNLPPAPAGEFREIRADEGGGCIWFTPGPVEAAPHSVEGASGWTAASVLGTLLLADIDIYPQGPR